MIAFHRNVFDESYTSALPHDYWEKALDGPLAAFQHRKGKRIRADLVQMAYALSGGSGEVPKSLVEFIETLHAGSLIVDDVQDNAATRRGRPTLHRSFGMPLAINTGNWMYFAAFEKLMSLPVGAELHLGILQRAISVVRDCHEGQALDLATNVRETEQDHVPSIAATASRLKTGGLVALAAWMGAQVAGGPAVTCSALNTFGMRLGIALQMQNDLVELKSYALEKTPSSDLEQDRITWPWAWAAQLSTPDEFQQLQQEASIELLGKRLYECVEFVGQDAVKCRLQRAFQGLRETLGENEPTESGQRIFDSLESYYV